MSGARKTNVVSLERLHELFIPDYEAGLLRWRVTRGKARVGAVAGYVKYYPRRRSRRRVRVDGRPYYNARLIWAMFKDRWPPDGYHVDHIDHDTLNDCIGNLRLATNAENMRNRNGLDANNTSGHRGVSYRKDKGRWQAYIKVNGKMIHLGYYATEEEASAAAEAARLEHFGEFAGSALKVAK